MVKRFLITTALEETWGDEEPVLFLGEWCRLYSRKDRWSKMDAEVLPYHWDDRAKLAADYRYLQGFYERLLEDLTGQLNNLHGVAHGVRYWRILIGPWLGYFIQMLFDRWCSIQDAISRYELSGTAVLCGGEDAMVPRDMDDFDRLYVDDEWNHHLYAAILGQFTNVPRAKRAWRYSAVSAPEKGVALPWKRRIRQRGARFLASAASTLVRDCDAFFLTTYLPLGDTLRLQRRLRQVPQVWSPVPPSRTAVEGSRREWTVDGDSNSGFETCARVLIPRQIPTAYLEGYAKLTEQTAALRWPKRPKVIWTSNRHIADDVFKAWAAEKTEQGSPLVIGQHGGHYGVGRWSFSEDHEVAISDAYLSWGWTDPIRPRVKALGQVPPKGPTGVRHAEQPGVLLVTCALPRYSYWMYSVFVAGQYLDYFSDQCAFVAALPGPIRSRLTVRLFPYDRGWNQAARWRDRFPDMRLDDGRSNIQDLVRGSRLYISTYNATTFLESFTMNVPTVIYWNPEHWELRDSAIPYFEALERVGIFHRTPERAARHVAAIWNDIDAWWSSAAVRDAVDGFKARYCDLPTDLLDRVEKALRDAIADRGATTTKSRERSRNLQSPRSDRFRPDQYQMHPQNTLDEK